MCTVTIKSQSIGLLFMTKFNYVFVSQNTRYWILFWSQNTSTGATYSKTRNDYEYPWIFMS